MCKIVDDKVWTDFYHNERVDGALEDFNVYNIYEIIDLYKTNLNDYEIKEALEKREFIWDAEEADYQIFLDFSGIECQS